MSPRLAAAMALGVCLCGAGARFSAAPSRSADSLATFAVALHAEVNPYHDASAFVMPDEAVTIEAVDGPAGAYQFTAKTGAVTELGPRKWRWTAPHKPGVYDLRLKAPDSKGDSGGRKDSIDVRVFVMVPASEVRDGLLNGYRIGKYPDKPLNDNPQYRPPRGFVEVTHQNEDTRVSPHFRLKQFECKEGAADQYPKYLVLEERLPLKLEAVLDAVRDAGFDVDTLHVMSGYRTPFYNHAIGDVLYSQHQWGRAADVFVDKHDKGVMDDLNGDGRIDIADARFLQDLVERLLARPENRKFQGGMGLYPPTPAHPPFVHVDVRGNRARWNG